MCPVFAEPVNNITCIGTDHEYCLTAIVRTCKLVTFIALVL